MDPRGFQLWAITVVALFIKMFINSAVQGIARLRARAFARPDDAKFFGRGAAVMAEELPIVQRAAHCWRNDLENIPIFLFLSLAYVGLGDDITRAPIYFAAFVIARVLHTVFYLWPRQPHRNLAYQVGIAVCIGLSVEISLAVFRG